MGVVVGQHRVDLVRNRGNEMPEEVGSRPAGHLFVQFDKGELGRAIDGDQQVELALLGPNFGDVDGEEADRVGFEMIYAEKPEFFGYSFATPSAAGRPAPRGVRRSAPVVWPDMKRRSWTRMISASAAPAASAASASPSRSALMMVR